MMGCLYPLQRSPAPALALSLQCPELSHRDPLATAYRTTSPTAKSWAAVPLVVPITANPSPGRRHSLPSLPLAHTVPGIHARLCHSTWAAWSEDARGWVGTCRPALHFPEGSTSWPEKGHQCRKGELESQAKRAGGWRKRTPSPRTLLYTEATFGGCQPALSSLPSFLERTCTEKLSPCIRIPPSSSPGPHYPSPRQA